MTKINLLFFVVFAALMFTSCESQKRVIYFQNYSAGDSSALRKPDLYDAKIKPKDILSITIVTSEPEASKSFNLITPQVVDMSSLSNNAYLSQQPTIQTYLVDNSGFIDFPSLGRIKVTGLTRTELEAVLQEKLKPSFNHEKPIITIRITNYSVNVLGEVSRPGKYTTINDRMTILDAIAQAGDLTIYGRRDNIKILRENMDGSKKYIYVNLNDKNVVSSPGYFLEQNDVIYVEPNGPRSRASMVSAAETYRITIISTVLSVASILVNVFR